MKRFLVAGIALLLCASDAFAWAAELPQAVTTKKETVVTGSPGGSRIIGHTAQSVMLMIDFGLDPQQAINVPHYTNRNGRTDIETPIPGVALDYDADALKAAPEARDHPVGVISQESGLSIIQVLSDGDRKHGKRKGRSSLIGGADARRDGTVSGS